MAFRQPQEQEQGVPSLGYRLSSNRQPGIEQSNNRMPQEGGTAGRYQGRRMPNQMPLPIPMPSPNFDYRKNMPLPVPMPSPDREFDFRRNMPMPMPMPMPSPGRKGGMPKPMPTPFDFREYEPNFEEDAMRMRENLIPDFLSPMAYVPGDDYGSYIPDSVIEMDLLDGMYGPEDEQDFDRSKGYENRIFGIYPDYNRGGIASLRR